MQIHGRAKLGPVGRRGQAIHSAPAGKILRPASGSRACSLASSPQKAMISSARSWWLDPELLHSGVAE
jgi:hypothetical protein